MGNKSTHQYSNQWKTDFSGAEEVPVRIVGKSEEHNRLAGSVRPRVKAHSLALPEQFARNLTAEKPFSMRIRGSLFNPVDERVVALCEWEQLADDYKSLLDAYREAYQYIQTVKAENNEERSATKVAYEESLQILQGRLDREIAERQAAEDEVRNLLKELEREGAAKAAAEEELSMAKLALNADEEARNQSARERMQRYFDGRLQEFRDEEQCQRDRLSEERDWIASSHRSIREDLQEETSKVNRVLVERTRELQTAIDEQVKLLHEIAATTVKSIDDQRINYYTKMHDWQMQLYRSDYSELAYCYTDLSRWMEKLGDIECEWNGKIPEELYRCISSQRRGIEALQKRFEMALLALGVRAFWARAGEPFDSSRHIQDDEIDYGERPNVCACLNVGFERVDRQGNGLGEVLLPARVHLVNNNEVQ